MSSRLLALNAGSSSLKFALYPANGGDTPQLAGRVERMGTERATLITTSGPSGSDEEKALGAVEATAALEAVLDRCRTMAGAQGVVGIGHRVVHGGPDFLAAVRVDASVIERLERMIPYDPAHEGPAIGHMKALTARWPDTPQVACFDTAFHATLPRVAQRLALPRDCAERGVRRYGFHGLSYTYLLEALAGVDPAVAKSGRVILAHLGNGASLAAVRAGQVIDTTMGFTPNSGLPMSTRSGELDPGVMLWLGREKRLSIEQIFELANRRCGLLAVSETSSDLRDLLEKERTDARAAEAVALFCHSVRKSIGALAAALGGLDTLVFSGGIGRHAAPVRARACEGLGFLGLEIDPAANTAHAAVISRVDARATVRVIATDEELIIARETRRVLKL